MQRFLLDCGAFVSCSAFVAAVYLWMDALRVPLV